jgi:hypothetical protein
MDDNTDIVERLRSMYYELSRRQASTPFGERSELDGIPALLYEAAIKIQDLQGNEIERLRNERDEARREVCRDEAYRPSPSPPCTANQVANRRGWDCFKDNTNE